ncbi:MAG: hypothetical protein HYT08_03060 [Candidatus Levybacteria bacterium]|nr:hypothetical protein [Candidatus Levybacteria bacterium]
MEGTTSPEIKPSQRPLLTGEEIARLIDSKLFKESIKRLHDKLEKLEEPFEAGFIVFMDSETKDVSIVEEKVMSINSLEQDDETRKEIDKQLEEENVPVIDFHFHPPTIGGYHMVDSFIPSIADLQRVHPEESKNGPIGIIGVMKGNGNIDMLFFKEVKYQLGSKVLRDQLDKDLFECGTVQEGMKILSESGYESAFGEFSLKQGLSEPLREQVRNLSVAS